MDDYIKREDMISALHNHYEGNNAKQNAVMDECVMLATRVPAADVRENIHAEWLHVQIPLPLSDSSKSCIQCSNCLTHWDEDCEFRYCPYCGAQMG